MAALRKLFEDVLPENAVIEDFMVEHNFEYLGRRIMLINARKLQRPGRLVAIDDITIRRSAEAQRDVLISEMSHRVKNVLAAVQSTLRKRSGGCTRSPARTTSWLMRAGRVAI